MSLNILQNSLMSTVLCEVAFVKKVLSEMTGWGNDFGKVWTSSDVIPVPGKSQDFEGCLFVVLLQNMTVLDCLMY